MKTKNTAETLKYYKDKKALLWNEDMGNYKNGKTVIYRGSILYDCFISYIDDLDSAWAGL